jgi:hypothetical protein
VKRHQFYYHLLTSVILFIIISVFLVINGVKNIQLLWLLLGIIFGSILLDTDYLIFWFFLKPNSEESRLIKTALKNHDFIPIIKIINTGRQKHYNLIFHHYFFQIILTFFSIFIFTSTNNISTSGLVLSLNLHLLVDELIDYFNDPKMLQKWLFAREDKQLPIKFLGRYLTIFILIFCSFMFLFIKMNT